MGNTTTGRRTNTEHEANSNFAVLLRMSAASSNSSATARTSVPVSWPRREYVKHLELIRYWMNASLTIMQLGTFGRAKRKVDEMTKIIAESRRAGH